MGTIHRSLKVRIYPTQEQEVLLSKSFGSSRFLFNKMLEERIAVYDSLKDDRRALYDHKYKTEKQYKKEFEWLSEVDAKALQAVTANLITAYSNFFKSLKGTRKGAKVGFPKFKKRMSFASFGAGNNNGTTKVDYEKHLIQIPKLGKVRFRDKKRRFEGKILRYSISRSSTGKYFASILYECDLVLKPIMLDEIDQNKVIGLDMSLDKFYVDNLGNSPNYKRLYRESEEKLKKLQRKVSKKTKGSKNKQKAQLKVNKVHEKIANSRTDFTHKLSTSLVKNYDVVVIESLSLAGMAQGLKLGKSVMDLGYSSFVNQLQYKSLWNNKIVIEADKWFASSKTCSFCGFKKKDLLLQERNWVCPSCNHEHNRDTNAGINLKNYGLKELGLGQPDFKPMENSMHKVDSMKWEASGSLDQR
jgi:putative transposase